MRRLLLLAALAALAAGALPSPASAAPAPACIVTATGKHTRDQTLAIRTAGCPAVGVVTGRLRFAQFPGLTGRRTFTLRFGRGTAAVHLPQHFWLRAGWTALFENADLRFSIRATPKRKVFARGAVLVAGRFTAGASHIQWRQPLRVQPARVTVGSVRVTAQFPGGTGKTIQVRRVRTFCTDAGPCRSRTTVETFRFPPAFTSATAVTSSSFRGGSGFTSFRETLTVVLRSTRTGAILGRSDVLAVVRPPL
jgi:hypothetical protein